MNTKSPMHSSTPNRYRKADYEKREPISLVGTLVRLEVAKGCHEVVDLAGERGVAGSQVTLNAQSGKERQNHLRNSGRSHPGLFHLNVHGEKMLQ
jgi:hypothetical protein